MSFGSCIRAGLPLKFTIKYSKQYGLPIRDIPDLLSFDITLYIFSVILLISFSLTEESLCFCSYLPKAAAVVTALVVLVPEALKRLCVVLRSLLLSDSERLFFLGECQA